ncbi:pyrroloquinoline quinone biosynthesis peptide chaperone PqqD [Komagataeibacter saccharivorans]|mgnify:FL=1|uniref:Coenzyme PQQ synthesis protein D n=1 Tax=Komagataeibacter saccharivorans TaxID=265959 RepID=A0A347WAK3_9PROT|nr:pyrroloquinoline quinone biosynthesis peptide chaperone PqqD [Komagataeibacter saccharivorans]AXY21896.1 Coenzyme PQQ synthesis protein D [Komagataeibacter saccharivorans]PYD51784.1 pyrroloquinoline quinone biosynthesis peptide chaperone PqqD [Komagataeibacter saccharivorans]QBL94173.1 Coenzyme PQQ synthesis protein D [Komagataeibacter saccharivorans]GBQ35475.1 pyrrolo-quinoline quinone synthesis protein PqqD [Komagataeibacter saccharivorans NRIC 0614]
MTASLAEDSIIRFARGVRLQHDRVRERWIIQAPERAFIPDPVAAEVLKLVDGTRTLGQIVAELASRFAAPVDVIGRDVHVMITDLINRQVLVA